MPPCVDLYVWVPVCEPQTLNGFIDRYVDVTEPGDDRLPAFVRAYITQDADQADWAAIAELSPSGEPADGFSLYLNAVAHYGAIITITQEGAAVLGLSLDDPDASPEVMRVAEALLNQLRTEFAAPAGCAGTELPSARSLQEWEDDALVQLRVGTLT
jgi:hypothetical protein